MNTVQTTGTDTHRVINPFTETEIVEIQFDSPRKIEQLLERLKHGLNREEKLPPFKRADILNRFADRITDAQEELVNLIVEETGKTVRDTQIEVDRAVNTIRCSSEEARRIDGELLDSDAFPPHRNRMGLVTRQPIGLVLAVTPFNFPINIPAHKIGPAFAAGNAILFKPAPQVYRSSAKLVQLCHAAGIPENMLAICCPAVEDMPDLVGHRAVDCVSFTGGVEAGKAVSEQASFKKVLMELGGNDPLIVYPDADLDAAARTAVEQRFGTAGQRCTAAKQIFVHEEVYEEFRTQLLKRADELVVGDPKKETTDVGPVISEQAADSVMAAISDAVQQGANVLVGNSREGNLVYPTVLENVSADAQLATEEVFGPVIPLRRFHATSEVVDAMERQSLGLQAGVFTDDLSIIKQLFQKLDVGTLIVNDGPGFRAEHFPFGGMKDSGLGREGVRYAIHEMSVLKTLVL